MGIASLTSRTRGGSRVREGDGARPQQWIAPIAGAREAILRIRAALRGKHGRDEREAYSRARWGAIGGRRDLARAKFTHAEAEAVLAGYRPVERARAMGPEETANEITRRAAAPSRDLAALALPGDAWERRLLVALSDHLPRQRWVAGIVERHLSGSPNLLASDGAFGHPEAVPQSGNVPGFDGWSYFFHGCGCCLTNRDGTTLDVDFDEHGAEGIDPFFYQRFLESSPALTGLETLLRSVEPLDAWMADLDGLRELGLIEGAHRVRLTSLGGRWAEALGPALREMAAADPERRRHLAMILADDSAAADAGAVVDDALTARTRDAIAARAAKLVTAIAKERRAPALAALASLGRERAEGTLMQTISDGPIDALVARAVRLIIAFRDPSFDHALLSLAKRASSAQAPAPFIRAQTIEAVLSRYRANTLPEALKGQALQLLRVEGYSSEAVFARWLFLLEPAEGLARLSRALHHKIPIVRQEAAACLAVLGTSDAAAILRAAGTEEARAALAVLRGVDAEPGPEPIGEMTEWHGRPPGVFRIDELVAASTPGFVQAMAVELGATFGAVVTRWWVG